MSLRTLALLGAVLRLVDHFCASRRSHSPPRGHYQPALVSVGRRDARAARAANDDPRDEFARQSQTRRQGARGCSRLPAGLGQKCGAVDAPAKMAGDPVARLPGVPQWPPAPRAAAARADNQTAQNRKTQQPHGGQLLFLGSLSIGRTPLIRLALGSTANRISGSNPSFSRKSARATVVSRLRRHSTGRSDQ